MEASPWRDEFPVTADMVFFNHAAVSPLPRRSAEAGAALLAERCRQASADYPGWMRTVADTRALAADLLGTTPGCLAFTGNTSSGLSLVAAGLPWREGDKVAVTWPDFPSVLFPWLNLAGRGVAVVKLPRRDGLVDLEEAARLIPGVRLVVASTVDWMTGAASNLSGLAAICRREGAMLCLDAIQSLGVLPLDVTALGVDFLSAGCHKWLLGPMGLGLFYATPEAGKALWPAMVGWRSVEEAETLTDRFALREDAGRFEPGTLDVAAVATLRASLSLLAAVGVETVGGRIFGLLDAVVAALSERGLKVASPLGQAERSGILVFEHRDAAGLYAHLTAHKVAVSLRGGRIRLSPHFYNDATDLARFLRILDAYPG